MHVERDQLFDPEEVEPEASAVAVYEWPRLRSGAAPLAQDGFEPCNCGLRTGTCLTNNLYSGSALVRASLRWLRSARARPFPERKGQLPQKKTCCRLTLACPPEMQSEKADPEAGQLFRSFLNRQMPNHPRKECLFRCIGVEIALGGIPAKLRLPNSTSPAEDALKRRVMRNPRRFYQHSRQPYIGPSSRCV